MTDALQGRARPGDPAGHTDPFRHNLGQTRDSRFTSWSLDRSVAVSYAGQGGVLLTWTTAQPLPRSGWAFCESPDLFFEHEVLICGTLEGAWVTRL